MWTRRSPSEVLPAIAAHGAEIIQSSERHHLIEAWIHGTDLAAIANTDGVLSLTAAYPPITRSGSVQTQGDGLIGADVVRTDGHDGAPFLVGAISDSALWIEASQSTGDLPPVVDRYLEFPADDEGRAMLEIVHDIAPGAGLAHCSGLPSELSLAAAIRKLAAARARVIVDDLLYASEPFFQDGIVAQAVTEVSIGRDVTCVSAAGNYADLSYESDFQDSGGGLHDFDPSASTDTRQAITCAPGQVVELILQWDDPFYTTNGVTHDLDVSVYDASSNLIASGTTDNVATQQPLEVVAWATSGSGAYGVEIRRTAGSGPSYIKYVLIAGPSGASVTEHATASGTVVGHAAAREAIAVGAVPFYDPSVIEPFSSVGSAIIYFDTNCQRQVTPEVRMKPDVVAPDNVNTTFFGTDIPEDPDTQPNFAGTSASAPHVAGLAALLLDANPHLTRAELTSALTSSATDLGVPGWDKVYGAGLANATNAVRVALATPDITPPAASLVSPIPAHGWKVDRLLLLLSEPPDVATALAPASYTLVAAGPDDLLGSGDDIAYSVSPSYDATVHLVSLATASPATTLAAGSYRLTLPGVGGIVDPAGNPLNGGTDVTFQFTVAGKSQIVGVEGGDQIALQPDGTASLVYPNNPSLGGSKWPQVMVGQLGSGGQSLGPFRCIPTDIQNRFSVWYPDIAMNASGGVVIYSDYEGGPDYDIGFRILDGNGRASGDRHVAGVSVGTKSRPVARVDMNAQGEFAIAWPRDVGWYLAARLYDTNGLPKGQSFDLNQQHLGDLPVVAIATNGATVFAWESHGLAAYDGSGSAIYARRFAADGAPMGDEFLVNSTTTNDQFAPEIAMAQDGSFAIVWSSGIGGAPGAAGTGIMFQRFDPTGNRVGPEVQLTSQSVINYGTGERYPQAQIAMAPDGRSVIAWRQEDGDGYGIFAQRFAADGSFLGGQLWISEGALADQQSPRLAIRDNGDFLVKWSDTEERARWVCWDAPDEAPILGPFVRTMSPSTTTGSVSSIRVTFDREIDASTLTADDIVLRDPAGRTIGVSSLTTTDNRSFDIGFDPRGIAGSYWVTVGPDVLDVNGRPMNQNGNEVNGEAGDAYVNTLTVASTASAATPLLETFEDGGLDLLPGYWSFAVTGAGLISVSTQSPPVSGQCSLALGQSLYDYGTETATLSIDLAGVQGASLSFWAKEQFVADGFLAVSVAQAASPWTALATVVPSPLGSWRHYAIDLSAAIADANLTNGSRYLVRFYHEGAYYSRASSILVDDVRIEALAADFDADPDSGTKPLSVSFTSTSTGVVASNLWSFGDGATSTDLNPSHTYATMGVFTVSLTVFGFGDTDTKTRPGCITVTLDPALDEDGDGLPNGWEETNGLDPFSALGHDGADGDPDGDGSPNWKERLAGTHPLDRASIFRILSITTAGPDVRITWATAGGKTNVVQASPDLSTYTNVSPHVVISGTGDTTTNFTEAGAMTNPPPRFYRIQLVP